MMEKTDTKLMLNELDKESFYNETVVEDFDLHAWDFDNDYEVVFENDKYKICKPTKKSGLIPLSAGTTWIAANDWYNRDRDKKSKYDDIDLNSWTMQDWQNRYVILDKNNPKKKWMFKNGLGDIYAPSYARYSCATWVADNGDEAMWRWFLNQKFPYISTNLDKKVGSKLITDKTTFIYPDDLNLTWYNKSDSKIKKIEIKEGTTSIKADAFNGLQLVEEVTIPNSVTSIGNRAFYGCRNLRRAVLPNALKKIGQYAFCWCTSLTEINIPETAINIGDGAFEQCKSLKTIKLPANLKELSNGLLQNCPIEKLDIPQNITSIGHNCLAGTLLTEVIVPNKVQKIGGSAFSRMPNLKSLYIPKSVTKIEGSLFLSWSSDIVNEVTINCEAESKPEGWKKGWDAKSSFWVNNHGWGFSHYDYTPMAEVNWGVSNPSSTDVSEDLDIHPTSHIGELNDEQCEKLLDLLISLPEMPKNNPERWDFITHNWLLGLNGVSGTFTDYDKQLVDSYINTLSNPDKYTHSLIYWHTPKNRNGNDFLISRFNNDGERVLHYITIGVTADFVENFLGMDLSELDDDVSKADEYWDEVLNMNEDLDLHSIDFPSEVLYEDEYWSVRKPKTIGEFKDEIIGTNWTTGDWEFSRYTVNPFFVFEDKKAGKMYLYNTRDSYSAITKEDGAPWRPSKNYPSYAQRTPSLTLSKFLMEQPNTEKLSEWCIKKWPSGLERLKIEVQAKKYIKEVGDTIVYKSPLYSEIKENSDVWIDDTYNSKLMRSIRDKIKHIQFPRNIKEIQANAFENYSGLTEVVIPDTVTEIHQAAFYHCENLKSVKLPKNIEAIENYAFASCAIEGEITIPNTCKKIGYSAFSGNDITALRCDFKSTEKPEGWVNGWNKSYWDRDIKIIWLRDNNTQMDNTQTNEDLDLKPFESTGSVHLNTIGFIGNLKWSSYIITSDKTKQLIIDDIRNIEQSFEKQKEKMLDYLQDHISSYWRLLMATGTDLVTISVDDNSFTVDLTPELREFIADTAEEVEDEEDEE